MNTPIIKKIAAIIYLLVLALFAISSSTFSYVRDNFFIFGLEVVVNVIIILGVLLYLINIYRKWWLVFLGTAIIGECYLLISDQLTRTIDILAWLLILVPAFILNMKVALIFSEQKSGGPTPP